MSREEFSDDKRKLLAQLLKQAGFDDEKNRIQMERQTQFKNFYTVLENVNKNEHVSSQEQIELQKSNTNGFLSELKRISINAEIFKQAYESDTKLCYIGNLMCPEILFAMDLVPFNIEIISSLFAANKTASRFLDIGEQNHLSRDICSVVRCIEGAMIEDCLPTPDFIVNASYPCDSAAKIAYRLKEKYKSGYFMLDIPYRNDPNSVRYLKEQIIKMICSIEEELEVKLDPEKLKQTISYSIEGMNYFIKTNNLYHKSFAPFSILKSKDYMMSAMSLLGSKDALEIAKLNYEEAVKELSVYKDITKTKPRVVWYGLTPFFNNEIIQYLETICGFDVIPEYNLIEINPDSLFSIDDPYIFLAQKLLNFSDSRSLEIFTKNEQYQVFEKCKVDGVIIFNQWGCRAACSLNQIKREALNKINIPVLEIDGDYIDDRNYSFSQIKVRIDAFAEILNSRNF